MAKVEAKTIVCVTAPWLKTELHLTSFIEIDGEKFFKIVRSDNRIHRLLTGDSIGNTRALKNADFLDALIAQRAKVYDETLAELAKTKESAPQEDLGIVDGPPEKKSKPSALVQSMPPTLTIYIGEVAAKVATPLSPTDPLILELTPEALNALRAQAENKPTEQEAPVEEAKGSRPSPGKGVFWLQSKACWRVRYTSEGKVKQKTFKPDGMGEDAIKQAADSALAWAKENGVE